MVSQLLVWTAIAAAVILVVSAWSTRRRGAGTALGVGIASSALVGSATGRLLPWDQLGLWAVTVGEGFRGYRPLFGDQVRYVVVGSVEVGPGTVLRWLFAHVAVAVLLAVLVAVVWRLGRRDRGSSSRSTASSPVP